jgi:tetratricopeptide (TPR) repeat protein
MPPPEPKTQPAGNAATLLEEGRFDEALAAAKAELANARREADNDKSDLPALVSALEVLAEIYRQTGGFEKSESLYQEAIDTAEMCDAPVEQKARLRSGIATLYDFNQREEQAIPHYETAIALYEEMTPARDEESAQIRNNLAMIYKSLKRYPLAEQHYLMALETLEKVHGRLNERVGAVFNNLGSLYYTAGFAEQAKEMHLEALDVRIHVFGPDHPEVAQSYCNLATACYELNDVTATQQNYEKSLRIYEQSLDTCAGSYEETAMDYIAVLEDFGETKKAEAIRKRVDKLLKK